MRVLFPARLDAGAQHGGDSRIAQECVRELRNLGCDASISTRLHENYEAFDIVHLFNINNAFESYLRLRRLRAARRRPLVLLTPFHHKTSWIVPYYEEALGVRLGPVRDQSSPRFNALLSAKDAVRYAVAALRRPALLPRLPYLAVSTFHQKRYVLDQVDALTVHTPEEGDSVRADFGSRLTPYWQVPIGRDAPSRDGSEPAMEPGYVLSVGRIEPLKNQLALIEALRPLGARLVLVGRENTRHPGYVRRVRAAIAASGNVVHLPFTPKPGLDALYRRASMHVIASWCEVFPLTTVEAAANGCRVVTTRNSYEAGIYGASVPYVNPRDIAAMRDTLARAVQDPQSGRPEGVTTRIHSWRAVAERLLEVYRSIAP